MGDPTKRGFGSRADPPDGEEERLVARGGNAIAAVQLGAVGGEIRGVDEIGRLRPVVRECGDSDRNRRGDVLVDARRPERRVRDGLADPPRDLQGSVTRGLGQHDRELFAA